MSRPPPPTFPTLLHTSLSAHTRSQMHTCTITYRTVSAHTTTVVTYVVAVVATQRDNSNNSLHILSGFPPNCVCMYWRVYKRESWWECHRQTSMHTIHPPFPSYIPSYTPRTNWNFLELSLTSAKTNNCGNSYQYTYGGKTVFTLSSLSLSFLPRVIGSGW